VLFIDATYCWFFLLEFGLKIIFVAAHVKSISIEELLEFFQLMNPVHFMKYNIGGIRSTKINKKNYYVSFLNMCKSIEFFIKKLRSKEPDWWLSKSANPKLRQVHKLWHSFGWHRTQVTL
jgi:hypothetical protein